MRRCGLIAALPPSENTLTLLKIPKIHAAQISELTFTRYPYFSFLKSQRPSFPTTKVLFFFDMSDHEIVGG